MASFLDHPPPPGICICITGAGSFQLPLTFRPGNRYRVTVRGLHQQPTSRSDAEEIATFGVLFKGSTEFRTGEGQYNIISVVSAVDKDMLSFVTIAYVK